MCVWKSAVISRGIRRIVFKKLAEAEIRGAGGCLGEDRKHATDELGICLLGRGYRTGT